MSQPEASGIRFASSAKRSERYADQANLVPLDSGWDMTLKLHWESVNKRWNVDGYAANLIKRNTSNILGVNLVAKF